MNTFIRTKDKVLKFIKLQIFNIAIRPPKYPREEIQESEPMLQSSYERYLNFVGNTCGCVKAFVPCCCLRYPYAQIEQGNIGIYQQFGRYLKAGIQIQFQNFIQVGPGLQYFNPCTDSIDILDTKIQVMDLIGQTVMTKDNITVIIDAAAYYQIIVPLKAYYHVSSMEQAVRELSFASLKNVVGNCTLQDLLEKRQQVSGEIQTFVDSICWDWGVDVSKIVLKDVRMNEELQEAMSSAAKEQRNAQAKIINAKADVQSAKMMKQAADILDSKAAMQIRYLETIQMMGSQNNVKIVFLPSPN